MVTSGMHIRDLHEDGDGGNPAESVGNLQNGYNCCGKNVCFFKSKILDSLGKTCMKNQDMTFNEFYSCTE